MYKLSKLLTLVLIIALIAPASANAEVASSVLISEVQTGSDASANEEFIELNNNSVLPVDLSLWSVEYHPATRTNFNSPSQTVALSGVLYPGKSYLLSRTNYLIDVADAHFTQALAESGGHIRLVKTDSITQYAITQDVIGWGTAKLPETEAATVAVAGESMERKPAETGLMDTSNNKNDFAVSDIPDPVSDNEPIEESPPEEEVPVENPETPPVEEPATTVEVPPAETVPEEPEIALLQLQITELLPNPASPATDDQDEFIEIYNPNDVPVDLEGYVLETGSSFSYHFVISENLIASKSYAVFYSKDNNLTLSNASGRARLIDINGNVVSQTELYDDAEEGASWILIDGVWQWSTSNTPAAANVLTFPPLPEPKIAKTPLPKSSAKKQAAQKAAKAKTASAKKASTSKPKSNSSANSNNQAAVATTPSAIHPLVLVSVGSLALLYGAYEYRHDLRNYLRRFRRN